VRRVNVAPFEITRMRFHPPIFQPFIAGNDGRLRSTILSIRARCWRTHCLVPFGSWRAARRPRETCPRDPPRRAMQLRSSNLKVVPWLATVHPRL